MRKHCSMLIAAIILTAPDAMAATFTAKAEEGKVTVYSTSTKPEHCKVMAYFTYLENNKREEGWTSCGAIVTKPGKNVEVCNFEDPRLLAPLITNVTSEDCKQ